MGEIKQEMSCREKEPFTLEALVSDLGVFVGSSAWISKLVVGIHSAASLAFTPVHREVIVVIPEASNQVSLCQAKCV